MRHRMLALVLFGLSGLAGCFEPVFPAGLQCSPQGLCPQGQLCDSETNTCGSGVPSKQDDLDDEEDLGEGGVSDNSAFIGIVEVSGGAAAVRRLGTAISTNVVVTCKTCIQGIRKEDMSFRPGGNGTPIAIEEIAFHAGADVAVLILESPLAATSVTLSAVAPTVDAEVEIVVPGSDAGSKLRKSSFISSSEASQNTFVLEISECTHSGGPTFATGGADVLIGVHRSTTCESNLNIDSRIDLIKPWLEEQIENAKPETCVDNCTGTCSTYDCATNSCKADNAKCTGAQTCNPTTFQCETPSQCQANTYDTASCGPCGRRKCLPDESGYGACEAYSNCNAGAGETCVQQSSTNFVCQAPQQICTPGQKTSTGCSGTCGTKTCNAAGTAWGACTTNNDYCGSQEYCEVSTFACKCIPTGTKRSCTYSYNPYTTGEQTCYASGSWSSCVVPTDCTPGQVQECVFQYFPYTGTKTCNAQGEWGGCVADDVP